MDSAPIMSSLFNAIKRQLWSDFIDNPILTYQKILPSILSSSIVNNSIHLSSQTATSLISTLFNRYLTNEFLDCEQSRCLYVCSKYAPVHLLMIRLLTNANLSNGTNETCRALYFIFGLILFRRRLSTRYLLQRVLPYVINLKSNEFMLEPNVYIMCSLINILITLELNASNDRSDDLFSVRSWKDKCHSILFGTVEDKYDDIRAKSEDTSVFDAYHNFLDWSSSELFSSDNVRPVNYFIGWLQNSFWMFSRKINSLKQFIKPKLIVQLSEYLPLQFPIEKVLSMLDLSKNVELEYASMVITHGYGYLQTSKRRVTIRDQQTVNHGTALANITTNIYMIPKNL